MIMSSLDYISGLQSFVQSLLPIRTNVPVTRADGESSALLVGALAPEVQLHSLALPVSQLERASVETSCNGSSSACLATKSD